MLRIGNGTTAILLGLGLAWACPLPAASGPALSASADLGTGSPGVLETEAGGGASLGPMDSADVAEVGSAPEPQAYDQVEKAGIVADRTEYQADGWIDHFKDGYLFGQVGTVVLLRMKSGHAAVPGTDYVVFREEGEVGGQTGGKIAGMLLRDAGVLRVIRVRGNEVAARVIKQYSNMLVKDWVRSRESQRAAYNALLKRKPAEPGRPLKGEVVGVLPPTLFAVGGDVVYLNLGFSEGAVPGLRLTVVADQDPDAFGNDDYDSVQPMRPITKTQPASDDTGTVAPTGGIAVVEVVNASSHACAARVVDCVGDVRIGDSVRYP